MMNMALEPKTPKEFRIWENPDAWMTIDQARRFVHSARLDKLPYGSKVCYIDCGEIADCTLANDFRGGVLVWYADEYGEYFWKRYANEDQAFQVHLNSSWT